MAQKKVVLKNLILPIIVWAVIILVFLNVRHIPYEFNDKDFIVVRYAAKVLMTILVPLALIHLLYKNKSDFGIHFPKLTESFKLALRGWSIGGPAGMTFVLVGLLGWGFQDWPGALTLSAAFLVVFFLIPKVTRKLPTRIAITTPNNSIWKFTIGSLITLILAYFTYEFVPILSKILYFIFIVGLGEELLFRGYIQGAFNRVFGKPFRIGDVTFGWGLFLASALFGLSHALVVTPPTWPWAVFTFVMGLTLGFIREKDGSILAAVLLHAMLDMPLVFFAQ